MVYESHSTDETERIGYELAKKAAPGEIYCLSGNLGAGKTVFARGFARRLGIKTNITSPTFTILNEYSEGKLKLYHFDLYRLENERELIGIGYDDYFNGEGVTLIEWPEKAGNLIPENSVHVAIETDFEKPPEYRRITIN